MFKTENGDILLHGDCMPLMSDIPDGSIDAIITDLPYGTTMCAWDAVIPFAPLWEQYERILKNDGVVVLTACQPFSSALVMSNPGWFRYEWIWEKGNATGFLNAKKQPLRAHESVLVFYRSPGVYNPQMTTGHERKVSKRKHVGSDCYGEANNPVTYDSTERYPRTVQFFSSDKQKMALHPTQKPVALMEFLVRTYTNENEVVLDHCVGSGTTAIACINTNRRFYAIEKEEKYYEVSKNRISDRLDEIQGSLTNLME